jgi:glycosyltransferase involved in cell wall biosynthesis
MHVVFPLLLGLSYIVTAYWTFCALSALRGLRHVPDLAPLPQSHPNPGEPPQLSVIVPARNEAAAIENTLRSLLAQTIPLDIFAVDDRSTDSTAAAMDRVAAEPLPAGKSLTILRIDALPAGWLGKPHAMALAARQTATPWLLFTDADVDFAPDVLERALAEAHATRTDHLVLMPTLILKTPGERMMTSFFQAFSLLAWRPWRISDPRRRDSIGIGAFNLVRAEAYHAVGGFEAQRFQVLDDVRLGVEIKSAGYRQRVLFAPGLIRIHWAPGALGMARNLTKNLFAAFSFSPSLLLGACLGLALICYLPLADLIAPWPAHALPLRLAGCLSLLMIALHYRMAARRFGGFPASYVLTLPFAAVLVLYAMLRSMILTLARGGVVWRGTLYPLRELRRHADRVR